MENIVKGVMFKEKQELVVYSTFYKDRMDLGWKHLEGLGKELHNPQSQNSERLLAHTITVLVLVTLMIFMRNLYLLCNRFPRNILHKVKKFTLLLIVLVIKL